ncbi:MAG: DUF3737 family protein [Lachnospiraceae bacterium]|nr:DUF3737 family protein [Lachnospiraceae bacterium]
MKSIISNKQFDEERALYNAKSVEIVDCIFAGPADGESVLKEARNVDVNNSRFSLRYPLWHVEKFELSFVEMDELTRAAIWYAKNGNLDNCKMDGIKAVRECENISISNCVINSPEFGWKSENINMSDTEVNSEYLFFDSNNVTLNNVKMSGKYSFQYMNNLTIKDSFLDTKDAFWHSKDVTVVNSTVKGEYLAWFSENLTLIDCKIIGTQPLCYCKNLKLINCTMEETDLSFEYSDVEADVKGDILSVKNPKSGIIVCDSVGEIIMEDAVMECVGEVRVR